MSGERRLVLAPRGRAGMLVAAHPGPPVRDPRKPPVEVLAAHQLQRDRARSDARTRGHHLGTFLTTHRSFGWRKWAPCDQYPCLLNVYVSHVAHIEYWSVYTGELTEGLETMPDCPAVGEAI